MKSVGTNSAIFLDRDGTINKLNGIIKNQESIEILEGAGQAIKIFKELSFLVIVVTNQPVIARGEISRKELNKIHKYISDVISKSGGKIDEFYYCPHYPAKVTKMFVRTLTFQCDCRKPEVGLIMKAKDKHDIDLSKSWVIGDSWRDEQMAKNLKMNYYRITNPISGDNDVDSLLEAAIKLRALIMN